MERYGYKAYGEGETTATIKRYGDGLNNTSFTGKEMTSEQHAAANRATHLFVRNDPGDKEEGLRLLQEQFAIVFPVPV